MTPFTFHQEPLREEWLDAYGHLNEAYYLVPFSNATWAMQDHFNIGVPYFRATACALYTVETHLRYLAEVRAPAQLEVETMILGADPKRIWFAHCLRVAGHLCASGEFMTLHYDTAAKRTTAMPAAVQAALRAATVAEPPPWVNRAIRLG